MPPEKANNHRRRHLFLALRLAIAAAMLFWVGYRLRQQGTSGFSWEGVDFRWLAIALVFGGLSVLGWAGRWWWFLRLYGVRARFGELLRLTLFADFFNLYFLGPIGADGIRLLLLSRRFPDRRGAVVGSLILDHVGGLFGGMLLYLAFSSESGLPEAVISGASLTLLLFGTVTFLGLGVIMEPPIQRIIGRIPGLSWLSAKVSPIYAGSFRHPWLFAGFVVSGIGTACAYAAYWAAASALGTGLSLPSMLGLMPVVDLIASLPVTISGIGVREGLLVEWLGDREDIGAGRALAVSLLGFAALGLWGLIGGLWLALWRRKNDHTTA